MTRRAAVRRSPFLVTYWESGAHWGFNYLTGTRHWCSLATLAVLNAADHWIDREELRCLVKVDEHDGLIEELVECSFLDSIDRPPHPHERALNEWASWNPAGGFFHRATRFERPVSAEDMAAAANWLVTEHGFPSPLKQYPDAERVELPAASRQGELAHTLRERRTWRKFGDRHVTLDEIATLLGLTFGVQHWLHVDEYRQVPMKTSPSGGSRHSIEAYLIAAGVDGLPRGTYHYCPDTHTLAPLAQPTPPDFLERVMPTQPAFQQVDAFIVMTSVFARMRAKYPNAHAYRVVHMDAGHLSQTFLLLATAMGLAPFCTAAIDAPALECQFDIDGVSEAVIHGVGVGTRPADVDWAPVHDGTELPRRTPPAWAGKSQSP